MGFNYTSQKNSITLKLKTIQKKRRTENTSDTSSANNSLLVPP